MKLAALLVAIAACNSAPGGSGGDDVPGVDAPGRESDADLEPPRPTAFSPTITRIEVEIDYETNEAPYTGPVLGFGDTFDVAAANFDRLFAHKKTLVLPRTLAEMQDIGAVPDEELTIADLVTIANAHRDKHDTATTRTVYFLFVSGHFADASGVQPNILGISLTGTGVVAMFKDVIAGTGGVGVNTQRYVEQSTLVHEGAHSFGLVGGDVPTTSNHEDAAHDGHCNNDNCVMYWLNEGASDATAYATQHVLTNNSILFDAACLADVDALTGGP